MKKSVKIVISVLIVILIIGSCVSYALLPLPISYNINHIMHVGNNISVIDKTDDCVTIKGTDSHTFKVLMFTDLHLDGKNKTSNITIDNLVKNIIDEKPDLVILGGDSVTSGFNKTRAEQLCMIFEKLDVYWAGVLGNHEGDNSYSITRSEMVDIFSSFEHCLMLKGKDEVWGNCNYQLNILNSDDTLKESFFFFDTGDEVLADTKKEYNIPADESPYDGVKSSQVQWYKDSVENTKKTYGDFKSIIVQHIPIFQAKEAAENSEYLYGEKLEGVCAAGFDSGYFDVIKELGTTKAVFFGHDHLNTFGLDCDGVLLSYIQPSGYGSYTAASKLKYEEKDWLQGYTVLTIYSDGTFETERIRNSLKEVI